MKYGPMPMIWTLMMLVVVLAGCTQTGSYVSPPGGTAAGGRTVFVITDAAADMGAVTSVKVTVDKVMVHSASEGWVEVSSTPKTYDLLELKASGKQVVLADVQLKSGTYQQVRLDISNVVVTDANGSHEAKLPSGELKVVGGFDVKANTTAAVTFDFVADESLHVTGKGEYIMAPVVNVESREDATVDVKNDNSVSVSGGKVKTEAKVGMDINGNVDVGVKIPANANISINAGVITIAPGLKPNGRIVVGITDAATNMNSVTSVKVTVDKVMVQSASEGWVTVSSTPKTYDLLQLKSQGQTALLADAQLAEGTYQQMRLDISKVVVTDASGYHEAKLPSGELKLASAFNVGANATTTAVFDFLANESLHVTGKGEYILAPVVHVEGRERAETEIREDGAVTVRGGRVMVNVTVGMDENGNVDVNLRIPTNVAITIDNGLVHVWRSGNVGGNASGSANGNAGGSSGSASANASVGVGVGYGN